MNEPAEPNDNRSVDTTLVDEMLRLSPAERLRQNDRAASLAASLRSAFLEIEDQWPKRKT